MQTFNSFNHFVSFTDSQVTKNWRVPTLGMIVAACLAKRNPKALFMPGLMSLQLYLSGAAQKAS